MTVDTKKKIDNVTRLATKIAGLKDPEDKGMAFIIIHAYLEGKEVGQQQERQRQQTA